MKEFRLDCYEDELNHQVIHMDQGACYCPEFRATGRMHDYPSRRLQLARAVYKGEIPVSSRIGDINFSGILSGQGERWQNFRESPYDCLAVTILCREMLLEKGYHSAAAEEFQREISRHGGLYEKTAWNLPVSETSHDAVFLDEETAVKASGCEEKLRIFFQKNSIAFINQAQSQCDGFEYFAYGLVEEGIKYLNALIDRYQAMKTQRLFVLSPKTAFVFTKLAELTGLAVPFEVVYLPCLLKPMERRGKTYVYAGSFNLRYLDMKDTLNRLVPAETGQRSTCSTEFNPLLEGNGRINELTIWQKPIGAEYRLYQPDDNMMEKIREDAFREIEGTDAKTIITFEPVSLPQLRKKFTDRDVFYYMDLI